MLPAGADRRLFVTYRALAAALERLRPIYRERMVLALAQALADGDAKVVRRCLKVLRASEVERAHHKAAGLRRAREGLAIERKLARVLAAVMALLRRLAGRQTPTRQRNK